MKKKELKELMEDFRLFSKRLSEAEKFIFDLKKELRAKHVLNDSPPANMIYCEPPMKWEFVKLNALLEYLGVEWKEETKDIKKFVKKKN